MRPYHYLSPIKMSRQPRRIASLSCDFAPPTWNGSGGLSPDTLEWWSGATAYRGGKAYTALRYDSGSGPAGVLPWLRSLVSAGGCTWLFGFRISRILAAAGWWDAWDCGEWGVSDDDPDRPHTPRTTPNSGFRGYIIAEDPPTVIHCRPRSKRVTLRVVDLMNYGIKEEFSVGLSAVTRAEHIVRWVSGLVDLLRRRGWGSLRATAGSQGSSIFRTAFIREPILVHGNPEVCMLERDCLYGGRCEVYRVGRTDGPVVQMDAEACYPTLASNSPVPIRLKYHYKRGGKELSKLVADGWLCCARVMIDTDKDYYPVRRDGRTIYPVGRFETALCGPELISALATGHVVEVGEVAAYAPGSAFQRFATEMLSWRGDEQQGGTHVYLGVAKLFANGLFGQLAQRTLRWVDCRCATPPGPWTTWRQRCPPGGPWRQHRAFGWACQHEEEQGEHPEGCRAVTAWLYSLARWSLLHAASFVGRDKVLYCDTDSLWVSTEGKSRDKIVPPFGGGVGVSYREVGRYDWVEFRAPKRYRTSLNPVWSGMPVGAVEVAPGCWRAAAPETVRDALSRGRAPGANLVWRDLTFSPVYSDRTVRLDGDTIPVELKEF